MKKIKKCKIKKLIFNSDVFKCPKCGYEEYRRVLGDVSTTPCTNCGHTPMYRVK